MTKDIIRVLSFDPGLYKMGYALSEYNLRTGKCKILEFDLILGDRIAKERKKYMLPIFAKQYTILCAIHDHSKEIMMRVKPDYVVSEGAFAHLFIAAFISLKLVIDRIRQAAHKSLNINPYEMPPKEVKAVVFEGTATKDDIYNAVNTHNDILIKDKVKYKEASEHEADAIAINYAFCKKFIPLILQGIDPTAKKIKKKRKKILLEDVKDIQM
jgi:Holliday junction resolvasome RuvABC endonuclease subunit